MTPEAFVAVAGGLAMVKVKAVFGAVRLAVGEKTFATVGWPTTDWAVVKLTPQDQAALVVQSDALKPEAGRRGAGGLTLVHLPAISEALAGKILLAAWRNAASSPKALAKAG
jgi:hypothetical protein